MTRTSIKQKKLHLLYRYLIRPIFFNLNPEKIHDSAIITGKFLGKTRFTRTMTSLLFSFKNESLSQNIWGISFKNPIGLSAGFDKDANLIRILPSVGFGFAEIGTVTFNPYEGNAGTRLKRLKKSKSLLVNYGLKNIGVEKIIEKIRGNSNFPLFISVGKTNQPYTAIEEAGIEDYYNCLKRLIEENVGEAYVINISCPNTFGGEPFTTKESLNLLLDKLFTLQINKPILLKMPINPPWSEFRELLEIAVKYGVSGVVIGNLNKDRNHEHVVDHIHEDQKGSMSGKPCRDLSNNLISHTYKEYGDKLVIVGVGGVFSTEHAYDKIKRGASLVQLITGMIYEGPQLIGQINYELTKYLKRDGYNNISEAIGSEPNI